MNIHRYFEMYDTVGFLHDIIYEVDDGKIELKSLATYPVMDGRIHKALIDHTDEFTDVTLTAAITILVGFGVMDLEGNYLSNTTE